MQVPPAQPCQCKLRFGRPYWNHLAVRRFALNQHRDERTGDESGDGTDGFTNAFFGGPSSDHSVTDAGAVLVELQFAGFMSCVL